MASNTEQRIIEIIVNGSKAEASLKDMKAAAGVLYNQIQKLTPGTDEFIQKTKQLQEDRSRINAVEKDVKEISGAINNAAKGMNSSKAVFTAVFAAFSLQQLLSQVINFGMNGYELAKICSDAFADIIRSTGMSKQEVKQLNQELGQIDTRTAQQELLSMAKIGAQINIAKNEMLGSVKSIGMATVALGDEFFGGAEEVATRLAILKGLFAETKNLEAGKAINDIGLGSAGTAIGPVIAESAIRQGQLGNLSPSVSHTLGLRLQCRNWDFLLKFRLVVS